MDQGQILLPGRHPGKPRLARGVGGSPRQKRLATVSQEPKKQRNVPTHLGGNCFLRDQVCVRRFQRDLICWVDNG